MAEQVISIKATVKTVHTLPRKVRLIIDLTRGKSVADAISISRFAPNRSAGITEKVLMSTIAGTESNSDLDIENLVVTKAFVNGGPIVRRLHPCARGSTSPTSEHTNHIAIVVSEK